MIDIHVQGSAWSEVSQDLRTMLGDEPAVVEVKRTDYEELEALHRTLADTEARYEALDAVRANLDKELKAARQYAKDLTAMIDERDARIAELEKRCEEFSADANNAVDQLEATTDLANELKTLLDERDARIAELEKLLADAEPGEEEQTEIPEVTEAPAKEYKKEEVRAVLMKCRAANIAISELLAPYGGSLGAVKKEDYAAVVAAAEKALEDK